jgi:hypothetical protein
LGEGREQRIPFLRERVFSKGPEWPVNQCKCSALFDRNHAKCLFRVL